MLTIISDPFQPFEQLNLLSTRVPNRPSGLASFGAQHRRLDRVNTLLALGRSGSRLEFLRPVQGECSSPEDPGHSR